MLYRASVEAVAKASGYKSSGQSFAAWLSKAPKRRAAHGGSGSGSGAHHHAKHTSALAFIDQNAEHLEQLEAEFEAALLRVVGPRDASERAQRSRPELQVRLAAVLPILLAKIVRACSPNDYCQSRVTNSWFN